eukprot:s95_g27.t1
MEQKDQRFDANGNALEELLGPMRGVLGGPQFIALLQQVMERLPDKYTLRDLRLSRNLARQGSMARPVPEEMEKVEFHNALEAINMEFAHQLAAMQRELLALLEESDRSLPRELARAEAMQMQRIQKNPVDLRSDRDAEVKSSLCPMVPTDAADAEPPDSRDSRTPTTTAPASVSGDSDVPISRQKEKEVSAAHGTVETARFILSRLPADPLRQSAERLGLEVARRGKTEIIQAVAAEIRRQQRLARQKSRREKARASSMPAPAAPALCQARHPPAYSVRAKLAVRRPRSRREVV